MIVCALGSEGRGTCNIVSTLGPFGLLLYTEEQQHLENKIVCDVYHIASYPGLSHVFNMGEGPWPTQFAHTPQDC